MDRKLNYLFGFLLVILFISAANTAQQWNVLLGLLLSSVFGFAAFLLQRLTLDGMFASIVAGTFILGFGGWITALLVLFFFISSTIITTSEERVPTDEELHNGRRNGIQVWSNGFWLMCCLVAAVVFNDDVFVLGGVAAIAVATADTWATELGSRNPGSTYLVTNFSPVAPGTNGGISLKGTIAALAGSLCISAGALYVFSLHLPIFLSIFLAGFLGCLIDSYFGAIFQRNNRSVPLPFGNAAIGITNNSVNMISTGIGALLAIIIKLVLA